MALSVASSVPEHYKRSFVDTFGHVIQQTGKTLSDRVAMKSFDGKEQVYTDLETLSFIDKTRLANSTPTEVSAHKRKMTKTEKKCQVIFDRSDDEFLGSLGTPDSEAIEAMRMAYNRLIDTEIGLAFDATVYGGVEPYTTAIDLPSSQKVAVNFGGSNEGLTPAKINEAIRILEENDINIAEEECCLAINPQAKDDLIAYVTAATNDTWADMIAAWLKDRSQKLFGLTPVMTNRLYNNTSTDVDTLAVYSKTRGIWMASSGLDVKMDIRSDLDHALQISAYTDMAFMRRYEETVVTIACDRTP